MSTSKNNSPNFLRINSPFNQPVKLGEHQEKKFIWRSKKDNDCYNDEKQFYKTSSGPFKKNNRKFPVLHQGNEKNYEAFLNQSLIAKINEMKDELEKKENTFNCNQKKLQQRLSDRNDTITKLEKELKALKDEKEKEHQTTMDNIKTKYINILTNLNKENEILKNQLKDFKIKSEGDEETIKDLNTKIKALKEDVSNLRQKYNNAIVDNNSNKDNINEDNNINNNTEDELNNENNNNNNNINNNENEEINTKINKNNNEIKNIIFELNNRVTEQENEISNLNDELQYLNYENKKLKFLSKEIIESRNDIEIFFLDSLNEVKKELYKEMKLKEKRGSFFPSLKKNYEENIEQKVDIKKLTPEMREKILRNLFIKINIKHDSEKYEELKKILFTNIEDE